MKTITTLFSILLACVFLAGCNSPASTTEDSTCSCAENKDGMLYVMNLTRKIKPEHVAAFKASFEKCKISTDQEPGCVDYNMYQSYTDSTIFFIAEAFKNQGEHVKHGQTEHLKLHIEEIKGFSDPDYKANNRFMYICPCVNTP